MMKKVFIILALMTVASVGSAQLFYYTPWNGNKSYVFSAGTDFSLVRQKMGENVSGLTIDPGLALSFRFEGDKKINDSFSYGGHFDFIFLAEKFDFDKRESHSGKSIRHDVTWFDIGVDAGLSLAYWLTQDVELQAGAGLFICSFGGFSGDMYEVNSAGIEVADSRNGKTEIFFSGASGISAMLQAKYFVTRNFFFSLSFRDYFEFNLLGLNGSNDEYAVHGGQRGVVMLGIGFKSWRELW